MTAEGTDYSRRIVQIVQNKIRQEQQKKVVIKSTAFTYRSYVCNMCTLTCQIILLGLNSGYRRKLNTLNHSGRKVT